jgi:hypothetical protein
MLSGLMEKNVRWVQLAPVINFFFTQKEKLISLIFTIIILLSCTVTSTQKINSKHIENKKSKVKITFSTNVNNGICTNCD